MPQKLRGARMPSVSLASVKQHSWQFWCTHLGLPLLLGLLLLLVYPATGIDDLVQHLYYDSAVHTFPLRDELWLTVGMHTGLKMLVIAVGVAVFGGWLGSFFDIDLQQERRRLAWIWIAMALGSIEVSTLKHFSIHHCPWDIAEYGGYAPHLALFDVLPAGMTPGRCFPGGHASGGFVLMALYFALRDDHPRSARLVLIGALGLGSAMGWAQTMRGAHFLSHTLWTAWVVWMLLLLVYLLVSPNPVRE